MKQDRELEIRRQFLDEAQEYLDTLDATILGVSNHPIEASKANAALRAAHSIKGGAGMMGFQVLSELAHRLEDSWKVLKIDKSVTVTPRLENLLLAAVGCLRQVVEFDRDSLQRHQASCVDANWLSVEAYPVFDALHSELGDPQEENAASVLSPEDGQDIVPLLFETEVEGCLQRLEAVLATPEQPCLREEVSILAQELGGLGEMLQLTNFIQLCQSVSHQIEDESADTIELAESALKFWRTAQMFAIAGQYDQIPMSIDGSVPELTDFAETPSVLEPSMGDWFTEALDSIDEEGYTDFQPIPAPARSAPPEAQVTDFKVLEAEPDPVPVAENDDATVRVPVRQLNQLNDLFGELTIDRNGLDLYLKRMRTLSRTLHERVQVLDQVNSKLRTAYDRVTLVGQRALTDGSNRRAGFDALELDRYGDLHLLSQQVMETIVQLQEVTEDIDLSLDDTDQAARNLNKTAKQMQSGLSQLRMRPISDILNRFPRALREWSLQYGKQIRFDMGGSGTLIDRNILETLSDPLMHLLRNAFDHGIESPNVRESRGKSPEGIIEIRAANEGNRTVITVRDDGEGIPIDKIRDRAEQMGLDPVLLDAARDEELLSLIFEPGFSTSSQVTALSGRGVGMDVVRSNLKQIRGEISVHTEAGVGTTFTLSVPFTLSTVKVLLVESAGILLAFPTDVVSELFLLQPHQVIQTPGSEVLNWQDHMVQLVRLQKWLRFNCPRIPHGFETPPTIASQSVIILDQNPQWFGIHIDRCWGEQEATIRKVEGNLSLPTGFSGCTILGDGRVVPLVNVAELLRWITSCERSEAQPSTENAFRDQLRANLTQRPELPGSSTPTVLVVDDSINVRRFLALTLERSGYRVEQAKDGQDAIERLEAGLSVQAVICDIEMPRLDGYGFLAKLRSDGQLSQLPVMMLTSRSGEKHRKLAENLGASAYFSKPYNEQVLLRTLESMVQSTVTV
ncbi:hybrid sensor histidine kinase/response regulator [Leptolyngbya sp. NIES-2104]|uniref:hybrid sensor histidine kinase/response regulator n=1 Tax=Leptolyngbya sp. NIES-2104 TaxID=1552121 RepID=UPI0006EC4B63|nr:hybrid sensor histidine kinase/response regulator [Leptolyngbya sp. NIES-2104]GAP98854.1 signal transduction histidine kinase CheA [Leptolyngbya sp. NIES-2104]